MSHLLRLQRYLRRHGPRLHRRRFCQHQVQVWWTTRRTRSQAGRVFHSIACKEEAAHPTKAQRAAKIEAQRPKCPRPDKLAFDTEAECAERFATLMRSDLRLGVYQCRCGRWHCGHDPLMKDPALQIRYLIDDETVRMLKARLAISESEEQEQQ